MTSKRRTPGTSNARLARGRQREEALFPAPPSKASLPADYIETLGEIRCYIAIELKAVAFDPAFVGQLNLYLSAVDDLLRHPDDKPTIGLLLCRSRNELVVEYALRDIDKPIGVAHWATRLVETLPEDLAGSLPTIAQIEAELGARGDERDRG